MCLMLCESTLVCWGTEGEGEGEGGEGGGVLRFHNYAMCCLIHSHHLYEMLYI